MGSSYSSSVEFKGTTASDCAPKEVALSASHTSLLRECLSRFIAEGMSITLTDDDFIEERCPIDCTADDATSEALHAIESEDFMVGWVLHLAKRVLEEDSCTARIRKRLVPARISEKKFWQQFFVLLLLKTQCRSALRVGGAEVVISKKAKRKKKRKRKQKKVDAMDAWLHFEEQLLAKPSIWLYKIAPHTFKGRENRCKDWDIGNPLWVGKMRIVARNRGTVLQFVFLQKKQVFLKSCEIPLVDCIKSADEHPIHAYFDAYGVVDSCRFFVFYVELPPAADGSSTGRVPFGFGMRERADAFDIRTCVADQLKSIQKQLLVDEKFMDKSADESTDSSLEFIEYHSGDDLQLENGQWHCQKTEVTQGSESVDNTELIRLTPPPADVSCDWTDFQTAN